MKLRVQHPKVQECLTVAHPYWFFRYRADEIQPDGTVETTQKRYIIGPIRGVPANRPLEKTQTKTYSKKEAELERDRFFAEQNAATTRAEASAKAEAERENPPDPGQFIFGDLAELWRRDHVEKLAAGRPLIAKPTHEVYVNALDNHILPRWKGARLNELRAKSVQDWLQEHCTSWHMMAQLRGVMSGIITKAIEWEIIPETFANPMSRVKLPKKTEVREKRILTPEQTAEVLARIDEEGTKLICETCLDTGTRIAEVTGLMIKHVDLEKGTIQIAQRNWRGDIDVPKTPKSRRLLALGTLTERYRVWVGKLKHKGPNAWVFPQARDHTEPRWDSGVRQALKDAARACKSEGADENDPGLDFPGFGPHSLRRANITWRQEFGSSLEASIIAGHSDTRTTQEYTLVPLKRQEELTRHVQAKRAGKVVEIKQPAVA